MRGSTKLPSAAGIPGMTNRKIITAPWSVNIWLYWSALMIALFPGVRSFVRTRSAKTPPRRNDARIDTRYITPMRLWSRVNSQDFRPRPWVR